METVGDRLRQAADKIGGLDALAEAAGIKRTTIYNYASGQTEMRVSTLVDVARVTGVSLHWLATGEDDKAAKAQVVGSKVELDQIRKIVWNIAFTFADELPRNAKPADVANQTLEMLDYLISRDVAGDEASKAVIQFGAARLKRSSSQAD